MTASAREQQHSVRSLLEILQKAVPFSRGLVLTSVPRGGLQVAQPANVSEAFVKAYSRGFHTEDRLSWHAILKQKAVRPQEVYARNEFGATPFAQELLEPHGLKYVVTLPLAAPVFEGYPGVVHVFREEEEGDFTNAQVQQLLSVIHTFDQGREKSRQRRAGAASPGRLREEIPDTRLCIIDRKLRPQYGGQALKALDRQLKQQMLDRAKRRMHQLNGHGFVADRVQFPDSHGDVWVFNVVTYRHYPALGSGTITFLCLQPNLHDWTSVRPSDFEADAELSRLIPALAFMQQEYSRGPTLVEIAKTAHLSPFHFHRRFTDLLGLTPKQFMLECQIHAAKTELLAGEKELAEIAKDCGFAHQSHFTSRFKQATGLTPTRWRRMVAQRLEASEN